MLLRWALQGYHGPLVETSMPCKEQKYIIGPGHMTKMATMPL